MESESEKSRKPSIAWNLFTKKGDYIATCNTCDKDFSYRAGTSNLVKHWKRAHVKKTDDESTDCSDDDWSDNSDKKSIKKDTSAKSTWEYFDVLDSDKFVARCKVCHNDVHYDTVTELTEHVKQHNMDVSDDEHLSSAKKFSSSAKKRNSPVWQYMKIIDEGARNAMCLLCMKQFSYMTTISNLAKHLRRVHPNVNLSSDKNDNGDQAQKLLISANGQLYEIETSDVEKDPIQTDTLYLEDSVNDETFVDNFQKSSASHSPPKKIRKILKSTHKINHSAKERIRSINKSISSDDDVPITRKSAAMFKKSNDNRKKNSSLEYFSQYMISLMEDLPKHVSEKLQLDILKQIMLARTSLLTPRYSVKIAEKPLNVVTLNNCSSNVGSVAAEITIHNEEGTVIENVDSTEVQNGE